MTERDHEYILAEFVQAVHDKAERHARRRSTNEADYRDMYHNEIRLLMFEIVVKEKASG